MRSRKDQPQEQLLVYEKTVAYQEEHVFRVEVEQVHQTLENGEEIIYWHQPSRSSQPVLLIEEALSLDDWMRQGQPAELKPKTRFEMLFGDSQAAVFVASPEQFYPPLEQPQPLPQTVEMSRIHGCLLNQNLNPTNLLRVCHSAFKSLGSDYLQSLQGFATAMQLYKLMPGASIDVSTSERFFFGATAQTLSASDIGETTLNGILGRDCK